MSACSDLCAGMALGNLAGIATDPRLHGSRNDESQEQRRDVAACASSVQAQEGRSVALLSLVRPGLWCIRPFLSQVVVTLRSIQLHQAIRVVGAIALLALSNIHTAAAETRTPNIADLTFKTGPQLKERWGQLTTDNNFNAAVQFFSERKFFPQSDGLTEITFRALDTNKFYGMFFIPFAEATPKEPLKHLLLSAQGPNGTRVFLGTITDEKGRIEVLEEREAVDGKVQEGRGQLKNFFKCSVVGCVPAGLGCLLGGATWLPCFCLWCGGSVISCGLLEIFFP